LSTGRRARFDSGSAADVTRRRDRRKARRRRPHHFRKAVAVGDLALAIGAAVTCELGDRLQLVDAAQVLRVRAAALDGRLGQFVRRPARAVLGLDQPGVDAVARGQEEILGQEGRRQFQIA
jgi:hypothetical protein